MSSTKSRPASCRSGYRTDIADLELVRRLATAESGLAVVATTRADGTIQASLVNAGVATDPVRGIDAVAFVARGDSVKVAHLRRRPHANVVFRVSWEWVAVEGTALIVGPDDPAPDIDADGLRLLLRDVFSAAGGTHDDWDEFDRVMTEDRRAVVLVALDRISSNG